LCDSFSLHNKFLIPHCLAFD